MSKVEIISEVSETLVIFRKGDQPPLAVPIFTDVLEAFARQLQAAEHAFEVFLGHPSWRLERFPLTIGQKRIAVDSARGNIISLHVSVIGPTPVALDALEEIWQRVHSLSDAKAPEARVTSLGTVVHSTTTTVRLPVTVEKFFPIKAIAENGLRGLTADGLRIRDTDLRFKIAVKFEAEAHPLTQELIFEPRTLAKTSERVFYVRSPLPSEKHRQLLDELVAKFS